jgi:diguanylate cyclase (GGDEF)-like protein
VRSLRHIVVPAAAAATVFVVAAGVRTLSVPAATALVVGCALITVITAQSRIVQLVSMSGALLWLVRPANSASWSEDGAWLLVLLGVGGTAWLWQRPSARVSTGSTHADIRQQLHRTGALPGVEDPGGAESLLKQAVRAVEDHSRNAARLTRRAVGADRAFVFWFHSSDRTASVRVVDGTPAHDGRAQVTTRTGLLSRARKSAVPFSMALGDEDTTEREWLGPGSRALTLVACGFFDAGIPLGAIVLEYSRPVTLDAGTRAVLEEAAQLCAQGVRSERLVHEIAHARNEIQLVRDTAQAMSRSLTLQEIGSTAVELLDRILPVSFMVIAQLHEDESQTIVFQHAPSATPGLVGRRVHPPSDALIAIAVRRREVVPYRGAVESASEVMGSDEPLQAPAALVVFPLVLGDQALGTCTVGTHALPSIPIELREQLNTVVAYLAAALIHAFAYSDAMIRATMDGMTGLLNHRTYKERATEVLARAKRSGRSMVVMLTDIDFFKRVNDTHGHAMGDDVLKAVAQVVRQSVRRTDIAARYGGEEFAVVLEDAGLEAAHQLAERIRLDVAALRFEGVDGPFSVTLSLGLAAFPGDGETLAELAQRADEALYFSKRNGRNQSVVYRQLGS